MNTFQDNASTQKGNSSLQSSLVAVVDDDQDLCELYRLVLERSGVACKVFVGGQAFLDFVEQGSEIPRLVICDFTMPEVDGSDIIKRIKSHPDYVDTKVLFCSGIGDLKKRALELGADDVLTKPVSVKTLMAAVQQQLGSK